MDEQTGGGVSNPQPPQPPQVPYSPQSPQPQPPQAGEAPVRPHRRGGVQAGVWLIVIGGVILAAQLMPGVTWWNFWPLIIVAVGIAQAITPGAEGWGVNRLFDGLVTIAWGLVFLAITLGYVGWSVMWSILMLWPVLLIALGFELLGRSLHQPWVRALGSIALIAALAYAVGTGGGFVAPWPITAGQPTLVGATVSEPVGGVRQARLDLDIGAAEVNVSSGTELVEAASEGMGAPQLSVQRTGSAARARLWMPSEDAWMWPGSVDRRLDVRLSDAVNWDVRIEAGAAAVDADLSDIPVRALSLEPGVSDCTVRLGQPGGGERATAEIEGGVSAVKLLVPEGVDARVTAEESGLAGHTIRGDFESQGGRVWQTPGYRAARASGEPVWDISVSTGVGAVTVDSY